MKSYTMQKQKVADEPGCKAKFILRRMKIISGLCALGFVVVLGRATYLHLADNKELRRIASKQYNAQIPVSLRRGKIFDRNGAELAVSLPVPSVYADPSMIEDRETAASRLAEVLNVKESDVLARLKAPNRFVWIKRRIPSETLKKITALDLPGIDYIEESRRFYPNADLASQVLGAVGFDSQALAGVELSYNDILISKKKATSYKRDARGRLYETPVGFGEQSDVGDIYLTIDKQIQFIAEGALRKAVAGAKAKDGVAVVMDPKTGDVLAMANSPYFDPNRYSKYPISDWRNRAVTDTFEPGSTFKVFVVSSAIEKEAADIDSVYYCEAGAIKIGKHILKDHSPYGKLTVEDIIKFSSNIGALKISFDLGKKNLYEILKKFGFGSETNVDFPGEVNGVLRNSDSWQPIEQATIAFGQGLSVTALQIASAFSAVVNGGDYYHPHLVARVIDAEGGVTVNEPHVVSQPISKRASDIMRYMLKRVVEKGGTGTKAASNAYSIGGKTGTAQKVGPGGGGYARGKYFASFIGFAPVEDPRVVVFVGINEPRGAYYGGSIAAPFVKEIIERSLNYMNVPPARSPVMCANDGKPPESASKLGAARKKPEFKKVAEGGFTMPDLTGLSVREVLVATGDVVLEPEIEGSGVAVAQRPKAGSTIGSGEKFSVRFELPR